jgi:hypothetical protein
MCTFQSNFNELITYLVYAPKHTMSGSTICVSFIKVYNLLHWNMKSAVQGHFHYTLFSPGAGEL